jgi:Tol biopolymer transport system component
MSISAGTRFGQYEIAEALGAGGMGEVYRAADTTLKRDVAIKVLPDSLASDADRLARFQREAEVLASLNHPNIAQIYGFEKSDGTHALVMELVEGPTLADRIGEGPLPPDEALAIAHQIADALEAAHGLGIVHRDIKPANIKLRPDGAVKVLDFGVAKALESATTESGSKAPSLTTPAMTQAGIILGTAAYMSPEQARGKPVDERADIWAFGCVLYEMLTGQQAFGGEDVMVTLARVLDRDTDLDSIPGTISAAVRQTIKLCLEKNPAKRVADIRDVRLALEGAFESWPRAATEAPSVQSRRAWPMAAAALLIGALLAGGSVWILARSEPMPRPVSRYVITPPATAPLANLGGLDIAISGDGRRLAYLGRGEQSDRVAIYVRELDALEARVLPGTEGLQTGNQAVNPFFSADGNWIGFRSPGQGIMRVSVSGGPPLKMLDEIGLFLGAYWTEDDTLIYSPGYNLVRVSTGGGGTPEQLTPAPENGPFIIAPVLLPGGRAVLFNIVDGNAERIAVIDLATGEQRILVESGQNALYAPTGHIVFARGSTLMAVPFDLDRLTVIGEPVVLLQGVRDPGTNAAADYTFSSNGTLVYVPGTEDPTEASTLVWVDRSGQVAGDAISQRMLNPRDPRLSPDGRRLVLTTGPVPEGDIWIYDLGGRPPIPLADDGDSRLPAWSPDGTEVAFVSSRRGRYSLYVAPSDGSMLDPPPLGALRAEEFNAGPSDWSADGELIVQSGGTSQPDIFATRVEPEAELIDIVVTADAEFDADLSPDGRWLAYVSGRTGRPEIWVKRYPDGVPMRISSGGGIEPRWSADGSELFYLEGNTMMAVSVDAGEEFSFDTAVELFSGSYFVVIDPFVRSYDVAPDGRFLMIEQFGGSADAGGSASIVVVENWFEELERLVPVER